MDAFLYIIGPAGCAVGMIVCMLMMARRMRRNPAEPDDANSQEIAALRAEIEQVRADRSPTASG